MTRSDEENLGTHPKVSLSYDSVTYLFNSFSIMPPPQLEQSDTKFHSSNKSANGFSVFAQTGGKVTAVADRLLLSNALNVLIIEIRLKFSL